jgi:hypothetical protein
MSEQRIDWLALAEESFNVLGRKELHVHEIAEHVEKAKYQLGMSKDILVGKFSSALAANCKSKAPKFKKAIHKQTGKPRKGIYVIKVVREKTIQPVAADTFEQVSTQYTGKAGEFGLLSELLFYGFNASIMSVDDGIDVVASDKSLRYYHFQVKTTVAKDSRQETFAFNLSRDKFGKNSNASTYYIFVMRRRDNLRWYSDYAVIPSTIIDHAHFSNTAASNKVIINIVNRKFFINSTEITQYINDFTKIK